MYFVDNECSGAGFLLVLGQGCISAVSIISTIDQVFTICRWCFFQVSLIRSSQLYMERCWKITLRRDVVSIGHLYLLYKNIFSYFLRQIITNLLFVERDNVRIKNGTQQILKVERFENLRRKLENFCFCILSFTCLFYCYLCVCYILIICYGKLCTAGWWW